MPTFKATFFFNTNIGNGAGWTESFFTAAGANKADLFNMLTNGYVQARVGILHPDYSLISVRIVDVAVPNVSFNQTFSLTTRNGRYPSAVRGDGNAEAPFDGVLMLLRSVDGARRRGFIIRGIPKGVINDTYDYIGDTTPNWAGAIQDFRNQIVHTQGRSTPTLTPWSLRRNVRSDPQPITALTVATDRLSFNFTPSAQTVPALAANVMIRVKGDLASAWFNGLWKVKLVDPGPPLVVTVYPKKRPIRGTPDLRNNITVQAITTTYDAVSTATVERGAKRDTGRPFGQLVGKQRVQQG